MRRKASFRGTSLDTVPQDPFPCSLNVAPSDTRGPIPRRSAMYPIIRVPEIRAYFTNTESLYENTNTNG